MNLDVIQSIIRAVLNAVGGTVIAKGWSDSSTWEAVTGGAVMLASVIWSAWHQRRLKAATPVVPADCKPNPKP